MLFFMKSQYIPFVNPILLCSTASQRNNHGKYSLTLQENIIITFYSHRRAIRMTVLRSQRRFSRIIRCSHIYMNMRVCIVQYSVGSLNIKHKHNTKPVCQSEHNIYIIMYVEGHSSTTTLVIPT